ncbi:MAG: sugar ABC transporter permease [Candidatus Promineifilaceae bacterium]|nr:sugar ABC transporter permease [Candidatus Promineifilaceae bacterium]
MATGTATGSQAAQVERRAGIFAGRRGRKLKEAIIGYLFLLPAFLIIFTFGLFPLAFSAYQSTLRGLNKIVGTPDGLGNYVRAIDNLAYVLMFWIAIVLVFLAVRGALKTVRLAGKYDENPWYWLLPATITAVGLALFARFFFTLLPRMLEIPSRVPRGQSLTRDMFWQFSGEVFRLPEVDSAFTTTLIVLVIALIVSFLSYRYFPPSAHRNSYYGGFLQVVLLIIGAVFLAMMTYSEIQMAYAEAFEAGESLEIWSQMVTISAGFVLLILSYFVWRGASKSSSGLKTLLRMGAAMLLAIGAWVLIAELPRAIAAGNDDWWQALQTTVFFAMFTIPLQFVISLTLATVLFQAIKGKTFFRMVFFLPYIAPLVGTAAAFRIIFSGRANAPVNTILTTIGFEPLRWLNEPTGIFQLMAGSEIDLGSWLAGPSLALFTIILYNVWTYVGFDMVIFLAGLGAIPYELYEAASIDGADRWSQFRHVTIPLLSPTIYFLMLLAVIGTFKAFNRIYVMRLGAALGTTDTASVVIFETFNRDTRYGYASALAMILLVIIIILTVINNRVAEERVFYG